MKNNKLRSKIIAGMGSSIHIKKDLLWTVCKGKRYWHITKLMLDSLDFDGDIAVISDMPIKYKNVINIIVKDMHPFLMKLQIDRIDISKYGRIIFSDSDIIFKKKIPQIETTKDIILTYDPVPETLANSGFFIIKGSKAKMVLNTWKKIFVFDDQIAICKLIENGTIKAEIANDYAFYPIFIGRHKKHQTIPDNIIFWHFAGHKKRGLHESMKKCQVVTDPSLW